MVILLLPIVIWIGFGVVLYTQDNYLASFLCVALAFKHFTSGLRIHDLESLLNETMGAYKKLQKRHFELMDYNKQLTDKIDHLLNKIEQIK